MPDADRYGDQASHTLCHVVSESRLQLPTLTRLGLGAIEGVSCLPRATPQAGIGRLRTLSAGKDTLVGHWELMGHVMPQPFPTYPDGFPADLIGRLSSAWGREIIGNRPASGTQIIEELGPRQLATGALIVYTSADSVLQIAAHEQVVGVAELYECCRQARRLCSGEHAVARVIARPFTGPPGSFVRTERRRDFPLPPPEPLALDLLAAAGIRICAVGKIGEIYSGRGCAEQIHTADNAAGMRVIEKLWAAGECDLVFANLVDFDTLYGHRNNLAGYADALAEFDSWLGGFITELAEDEVLIITADHGCDPATPSTDHSREYVPLIMYGKRIQPANLGTIAGLRLVGDAVCNLLGVDAGEHSREIGALLRANTAGGSGQ